MRQTTVKETEGATTALAVIEPKTHPFYSPAEMRARSILSRIESISAKLKTLEDDIRALWVDFNNLKAGETILGCATKKEFCEKKLHRHPRTIQYLLAGQSNPVDRPHKAPSELSSPVSNPEPAEEIHPDELNQQPAPAEPEIPTAEPQPTQPVEPAEPSKTVQLREWFTTKYKAFKLSPSEQGFELTLFNLTPAQVKAIGELLGKQS